MEKMSDGHRFQKCRTRPCLHLAAETVYVMPAISRRLRVAAYQVCVLAALAAAIATVACADHGGALATAPSSKPLPLFHLGLIRHAAGGGQFFYGLTVMNCAGDKPYWTFGERGAKGAPPDTVTYGVPPVGYATVIGPVPLDPGCYRVLVTGGASARFEIAPDGRVVAHDSTLVTTTAAPDSATH